MPDAPASAEYRGRMHALLVVCVLAIASLVIALLGASPRAVTASELLGAARDPGEAAFIAGHRGDSTSAPENTLPAVESALTAGYDYVEVDVSLTADRHAVLMHDATVDRTTDGTGAVAELTLDQVRTLDAGAWFGPAFAGTRVPTLEEFLDVLATSTRRGLVELKGEWDAASVSAFIDAVAARGLERRIAAASFDARTLALVAAASDVVSRLAILRTLPDDVVAAALALGVRGIIVNGGAVLDRPEVVDDLHAAGMRVVVYTFNRDKQWSEALEIGVDGIVTDEPASLAAWLAVAGPAR